MLRDKKVLPSYQLASGLDAKLDDVTHDNMFILHIQEITPTGIVTLIITLKFETCSACNGARLVL